MYNVYVIEEEGKFSLEIMVKEGQPDDFLDERLVLNKEISKSEYEALVEAGVEEV